jgi:hypothetical protein
MWTEVDSGALSDAGAGADAAQGAMHTWNSIRSLMARQR